MAIAYPDFFFDGFDSLFASAQMQEEWIFTDALALYVITTHAQFGGDACIRTRGASNQSAALGRVLSTDYDYVLMGYRGYNAGIDATGTPSPIFFTSAAGAARLYVLLVNGSSGDVSVRVGAPLGAEILAVAAYFVAGPAFYEVEVYVHAVDGFVGLYRDGNLMGSFAGDTSAIGGDIGRVYMKATNGSSAVNTYHRDFYCCGLTGWATEGENNLGPGEAEILLPDSDESVDFTPTEGDNHSGVDDAPNDEDATYNESETDGDDDIFGHPGYGGSSDVFAVAVEYVARKTDAGVLKLQPVLISGAVRSDGPDFVPSDTHQQRLGEVYLVDPEDSGAWSTARVDALTFGYENLT